MSSFPLAVISISLSLFFSLPVRVLRLCVFFFLLTLLSLLYLSQSQNRIPHHPNEATCNGSRTKFNNKMNHSNCSRSTVTLPVFNLFTISKMKMPHKFNIKCIFNVCKISRRLSHFFHSYCCCCRRLISFFPIRWLHTHLHTHKSNDSKRRCCRRRGFCRCSVCCSVWNSGFSISQFAMPI